MMRLLLVPIDLGFDLRIFPSFIHTGVYFCSFNILFDFFQCSNFLISLISFTMTIILSLPCNLPLLLTCSNVKGMEF